MDPQYLYITGTKNNINNYMHGQTQEMICYRPLQSRRALWLLPERVLLYACIVTPAKWVPIEHRLFQFTINPTTIIKKMLQHLYHCTGFFQTTCGSEMILSSPKTKTQNRGTLSTSLRSRYVNCKFCEVLRTFSNLKGSESKTLGG